MNNIKLTYIIATTGRSTLKRMMESLLPYNAHAGDQIIVATNAVDAEKVHSICAPYTRNAIYAPRIVFTWMQNRGNNWGHAERNYAIDSTLAIGDYLLFGDDDDAFFPGVHHAVASVAARDSNRPIMFKMIDHNGAVLWLEPRIRKGNHGTPMFVVPNIPKMLGRFGNRYEGDFDFVQSTLAKYELGEEAVVWNDIVIYGCRDFADAMTVRTQGVEGA